tara:strand:+ start:3115 stop:3708 length:594 start_codon:yes stop_codon:yes gene_type:complete
MPRTPLALTLLTLALLAPQVAEAKYRLPTAPELLGKSSLIVVGEVEAVGERHYTVKITQQIVGPKKALRGSIQVFSRPSNRRICAPIDPEGIKVGTRWVWILEPSGKLYRSWTSAPLAIHKDSEGVETVSCSRLATGLTTKAQTLEEFAVMLQAYRRCYRIERHNKATQLGSDEELAAFKASSPHAAALAKHTPSSN